MRAGLPVSKSQNIGKAQRRASRAPAMHRLRLPSLYERVAKTGTARPMMVTEIRVAYRSAEFLRPSSPVPYESENVVMV
jgi:hypothetical protein